MSSAIQEHTISITLDGYHLPTDPQPIGYKGRVMVPFRAVTTALGLHVDYEASTRTIIAKNQDNEIRFKAGDHTVLVNGKPQQVDAEPIALDDRSYVPVRFLSETIGAQVDWDNTTHTVIIRSQPRHLHTEVFYGLNSYEKHSYLAKFDEAVFTWSHLDGTGKLAFDQNEYSWPEGADDLLSSVRSAKVGTSLMVYSVDEQGELTKLINDTELTTQFATDLVAKLQQQNMDTAVLDFETLGDPKRVADIPAVRAQYVSFVHTVAKALHEQGKKLVVVMAPTNGWYQGYDYKGIAQYADQLYIMAYSYIEDKKPQPLDQINEAIAQAVQDVDPSKLTLGINAFSETPQTVKEKIGLAKRYNLYGVGFWILKLFDDPFVQSVDASVKLNPGLLP
ncbi:MAG: stalk domain-containing protein [Tumebacillaceae bacterium]